MMSSEEVKIYVKQRVVELQGKPFSGSRERLKELQDLLNKIG